MARTNSRSTLSAMFLETVKCFATEYTRISDIRHLDNLSKLVVSCKLRSNT
jgi:hypothetical protein